jgi:hypothetical protein
MGMVTSGIATTAVNRTTAAVTSGKDDGGRGFISGGKPLAGNRMRRRRSTADKHTLTGVRRTAWFSGGERTTVHGGT